MQQEEPFAAIRAAGTQAPNYDLETDDIINHLDRWRKLCSLRILDASEDTVSIAFDSLPEDMEVFVRDIYRFCADVVEQGTGCVAEMIDEMGELHPAMLHLVNGVDLEDPNSGLEILKRLIQADRQLSLWWD